MDINIGLFSHQIIFKKKFTHPILFYCNREDTVVESINESRQRSETSCNSLSDKTQTEDAGHRSSMTAVNFKVSM